MITPDSDSYFKFEEGLTYLDHGGFGVTPQSILEIRHSWLKKIESLPRYFHSESPQGSKVAPKYRDYWEEMRGLVARRFNAAKEDLALVTNTTEGINAILRSLHLKAGDQILTTSLGYGGIGIAAETIAKSYGAECVQVALPFPAEQDSAHYVSLIKQAITKKTRIAILDHITSATALVMPIKEMLHACRECGVPVLIDGAHVPGQLALDIADLNPDWYVANLHKWYFVPRSCAFLWAAKQHQKQLLPPVLSWDTHLPFPDNFCWTGTRDLSQMLCIPDAFDFMDSFGEQKVRDHNHALAYEGVAILSDAWKVDMPRSPARIGSMAVVPLPEGLPFSLDAQGRRLLQERLYKDGKICVGLPPLTQGNRLWVRISAQIYNKPEDYQKLAQAVLALR